MSVERPSVGVGAAVFRGDTVLLVQRAKPPGVGRWSVPGGHQEWGETAAEGAAREVLEETGIVCGPLQFIAHVDGIGPLQDGRASYHYTLLNFWGHWVSGEPVAADDAADARWVRLSDLGQYDMWPETRAFILKAANVLAVTGANVKSDT